MGLVNDATWQVTMVMLELQPSGSAVNDTSSLKVISMPGSVSKSRCWTVTDHDADEVASS